MNRQNQLPYYPLSQLHANFQKTAIFFSFFLLHCWFCNFSSPLCPFCPYFDYASLVLLPIYTFLCVCLQFCFSYPCHSAKIFFVLQISKFSNQTPKRDAGFWRALKSIQIIDYTLTPAFKHYVHVVPMSIHNYLRGQFKFRQTNYIISRNVSEYMISFEQSEAVKSKSHYKINLVVIVFVEVKTLATLEGSCLFPFTNF